MSLRRAESKQLYLPRLVSRGFARCSCELWAYQCRRSSRGEVQVDHRQSCEGPVCVLGQAPVADLGEAPQALEHEKRVLDPGSGAALRSVPESFGFVNAIGEAHTPVGEVSGLRRSRLDDGGAALVAAVAIDPLLGSVQQVRQRVLVVH